MATADKRYVILIQPGETDVDLVVNKPYLPLALLSVSRYIHQEYSVVIVDQRADKDWKERLSEYLKKDVLCVGVSCLLGSQIRDSLNVSRFVKNRSDCPVIWGGIHHPVMIEQVLKNPVVDGVIQGEGETKFAEVVRRLDRNENLDNIPGYYAKGFPENKANPGVPFLDMDSLPDLPYHLIDLRKYKKYRGGEYSIPFESSRGCNFRCAFCACPQYSSKWRGLSADRVVSNIKYLSRELKIRTILIIDDNFFEDIERAKEIFRRLIDDKIKVNLDIQGMRIDTVEKLSDEELTLMSAAGVRKVNIGIESGSPRILKFINKAITVEQALQQNKRLSKYGPWVQYNFITGYPTETHQELRDTVRLAMHMISENKKAMLNYFCIYTPLPGTKLYSYEKERGSRLPETIEEWAEYDRIFISGRKELEFNRRLNILALFVDKKVCYYTKSIFLRLLAAAYRPIARFRMKHFYFKAFLEGRIFMAINRLKFKF
jgi:anaerobic magnesium-protoporphyrin IX monomethyl ester cyclase